MPAAFVAYMRHRDDDAISVTSSWHDGTRESWHDGSNMWRFQDQGCAPVPEDKYTVPFATSSTMWHPTNPHEDYIPYCGPVEPPSLPHPCPEWRDRPLPPLPHEPQDPGSNLLGLSLWDSRRWSSRTARSDRPPRMVDTRITSMISDVSNASRSSVISPIAPTTTSFAFGGRRSVAFLYSADAVPGSTVRGTPILDRSRSDRLLMKAKKAREAELAAATLERCPSAGTAKSSKRSRSTMEDTSYLFTGFGSDKPGE